LQYVRVMEHYRRTAHTKFDIKFHLVWITKYRKKLLQGDVGLRLRQIVRTICAELEVEILKGHVSVDHVHLFVSCPPHVSASYLMQRVKGKSSRRLLQESSHLNKQCWGRHLWARGFFVASSGNVTDEVIMEYIRTQELTKDDDDFRVSDG
jgi:putative transposase